MIGLVENHYVVSREIVLAVVGVHNEWCCGWWFQTGTAEVDVDFQVPTVTEANIADLDTCWKLGNTVLKGTWPGHRSSYNLNTPACNASRSQTFHHKLCEASLYHWWSLTKFGVKRLATRSVTGWCVEIVWRIRNLSTLASFGIKKKSQLITYKIALQW